MKDEFIQKCPNWLFVPLANTYYQLLKKDKLKIKSANWLLQKGDIELLSPTPKFLGFGMGEFEARFERFFKIERGDTCLDIGACIGDTTIPMLLKTGSSGSVIAVEPDPTNILYLKLNLAKFPNAQIVGKAVWKTSGTIRFNLHITPTGHSIMEDVERKSFIDVPCDTLDNILEGKRVDFAKIDVQGAESEVLEGANKFLGKVHKLAVETHCRYDAAKRTYPQVLEKLSHYDFSNVQFCLDNGMVYAWRK